MQDNRFLRYNRVLKATHEHGQLSMVSKVRSLRDKDTDLGKSDI